MAEPQPSMGRIVHYRLHSADVAAIRQRDGECSMRGNAVHEGDAYPAIVTRAFDDGSVNLQVFLDGNGSHWATSRKLGDEPGNWFWPPRVASRDAS